MLKLGSILNNLFGIAYIKNLKDSIERKNFVINECNSIDLKYEIVEAVDGTQHCDNTYTIKHGRFAINYPASAGFLGVHMSTQNLILTAIETQKNCIMILDDDCVFSHTNHMPFEQFNNLQHNLPQDWDVIILGSIQTNNDYKNTPINYLKCTQHNQAAGSHGIVINNTIYSLYHDFLAEKKVWGDGIIGTLIDMNKHVYIVTPSICQQNRIFFSDINKKKHTDCCGTAIMD